MARRITLNRLDAADPRMLDQLESLNFAYGLGFLLGVGIPYAELDPEEEELRVTVRESAWKNQWRMGIRDGRRAR